MKIRSNFLILSSENIFRDDEVLFQDDNASCYIVKGIKASESHRKKQKQTNNNITWGMFTFTLLVIV